MVMLPCGDDNDQMALPDGLKWMFSSDMRYEKNMLIAYTILH